MRSNITTNIVVTLVLSQEEAAWLHAYMQNCPLPDPSQEASEDMAMRFKFFDATHTPN